MHPLNHVESPTDCAKKAADDREGAVSGQARWAPGFSHGDMELRQLIAGNWKMNGLARRSGRARGAAAGPGRVHALRRAGLSAGQPDRPGGLGSQRRVRASAARIATPKASGAFTGDISAEMLKDAGASAVIVGHSERRQYHGETRRRCRGQGRAAWRAGLLAIICIGETEAERDAGKAPQVCHDQIAGSVPDGATAGQHRHRL